MIDRSLNYGRHHTKRFLSASMPYATVLDLGAGHGDDLLLAREVNPWAALHAIEGYPEYARELAEKKIAVHVQNIEKDLFPFDDGTVNLIIANQILEHTKEIFWIFHEITRVLPVGGKAIIGVPNLAALHNRILLAFGRQPSPIKTHSAHIRGFTKTDMLKFLEACFPEDTSLRLSAGATSTPSPRRSPSP
jgi:SAM-dependent methyltransferase